MSEDIKKTILSFSDRLVDFEENKSSVKLEGFRVEVTGKLYKIGRSELLKLAVENGADTKGQFNLLVANASSTSGKYVVAEKRGIRIITEEEFFDLLK